MPIYDFPMHFITCITYEGVQRECTYVYTYTWPILHVQLTS